MTNMEKILAALTKPKSATELAAETGIDKDRIYVDVSTMRRRGKITNTADGKYARIAEEHSPKPKTEGTPRFIKKLPEKEAVEPANSQEKQEEEPVANSLQEKINALISSKKEALAKIEIEYNKLAEKAMDLQKQVKELEDALKETEAA